MTLQASDLQKPLLFEISWEVTNKVGGIYTMLKSKAPVTMAEFGNRHIMIGPLVDGSVEVEVMDMETIPSRHLRDTLLNMKEKGVEVVYGRWLVDASPTVILFDVNSARTRLAEWKDDLSELTQIPLAVNDAECNLAILFGYLVAWFLGEFSTRVKNAMLDGNLTPLDLELAQQQGLDPELSDRMHSPFSNFSAGHPLILAHFYDWMSSVGLILLHKREMDIATIFTIHQTLLGKFLAVSDVDYYNNLRWMHPDVEASKRGIFPRFALERLAAQSVHVFTTVSHMVAYECEQLLDRKADGVLPPGINSKKMSALHEFQVIHAQQKEKLHEFTRSLFVGHYDFNLDNTLYFFTAGRYEFRNKGIDLIIEALARANEKLKTLRNPVTVVAFLVFPATTNGLSVEALKGQAVVKQLRQTVQHVQTKLVPRLLETAARGKVPDPADVLKEDDLTLLKRGIYALKRDVLPPVVTHNLLDPATDPIMLRLRKCGLQNAPEDRVKVVFHPEHLSSSSPLLPMDLDDFVRGCHLGVFPSYYEPWGYSPAECTVMGCPSITSNLSGFGCLMDEVLNEPSEYGIYIVDRRLKNPDDQIQQLADYMVEFCQRTRRQRINQRNRCERLSELLDWKRLGTNYQKARWFAIRRKWPEYTLIGEEEEDTQSNYDAGEETPEDEPRKVLARQMSGSALSAMGRLPLIRGLTDDDSSSSEEEEEEEPLSFSGRNLTSLAQ